MPSSGNLKWRRGDGDAPFHSIKLFLTSSCRTKLPVIGPLRERQETTVSVISGRVFVVATQPQITPQSLWYGEHTWTGMPKTPNLGWLSCQSGRACIHASAMGSLPYNNNNNDPEGNPHRWALRKINKNDATYKETSSLGFRVQPTGCSLYIRFQPYVVRTRYTLLIGARDDYILGRSSRFQCSRIYSVT